MIKTMILSAAAALIAAAPVSAADWPAWGGPDPGRNMASPETGLPEIFKAGEKSPAGEGMIPGTTENVRWVVKLGSYICSTPTVADGRVFIGSDDATLQHDSRLKRTGGGIFWCLDEKTGRVLWRLPVPQRPQSEFPKDVAYGHQKYGVCSTAAVAGNRAYLLTSACEILCLDVHGQADGNDGPFTDEGRYIAGAKNAPVELEKTDGDIIWRYDLVDQLGICPHDMASCGVLADGRFLYSVSANGVDIPHKKCLRPDAPSFIALDTETGKLLATDTEGLGHRLWHCLWSSPSLGAVNGKKLVFFGGGDGVCYAFEALQEVPTEPIHFKKVWSYDCDPPNYRDPLGDGKPFNYYSGDGGVPGSVNTNDGTFLGPSEIIATPVFHEGRVYVAIGQDPTHGRGRGLLHCIDASKTGDITHTGCIWTYDGIERSISTVAISDGLLYAADVAGRVHCLDEKTGKLYWVYDTHVETWTSPMVADGKVYIGTQKKLITLAAGRETKLLSEVRLGNHDCANPIAANGTLFVCSNSYLWAVQKGAKLESTVKPEAAGDLVGPYKLIEQIGGNGYGTVWMAEQEKPEPRRVALKLMKPQTDSKQTLARFEQERTALASLNDPHIAKVLDGGVTPDGRPYFAMELVRGSPITDYCDGANLPIADRLRLFVSVCRAVQQAHEKGIIHYDLNPSTILVSVENGAPTPKVIDLGVVAATQQRLTDLTVLSKAEQAMGAPFYLSPEQAEMGSIDLDAVHVEIDARTDVYSLGVLLYKLVTGRLPFDPSKSVGRSLDELFHTIRLEKPAPPSDALKAMANDVIAGVAQHRRSDSEKLIRQLRGDLDSIVMRAMAKDVARRYATPDALAQDLERHLNGQQVTASAHHSTKPKRHKHHGGGAIAAIAAILLLGLGGAVWWRRRAKR